MLKDAFFSIFYQKLAPSRVLNAIIFGIDEQCNLIFETALFTNCKIYIIIFIKWSPLSFLLCLSHFRFFPISPFLCSLSLSLCSTSLPPNPWLTVNDHPNHKPIVQITNPWLICDWPQISHQPSSQRPKASKIWQPTVSNGPMATHAI